MFTLQGPAIAQTLTQGGLAAPQAAQLTNLIANCRQPLEHRGPVNYDITIPQMRQIMPADVKTGGAMPNFGEAFNPPEHPPGSPPDKPPEQPPVREPEVGDTINNDNRTTNNYYTTAGVEAGKYIETQKTKVSVKTSEGGGKHVVFGDNVFKGVTFKFEEDRGADAPALTGSFEERDGETVLKLGLKTRTFTYVKGITLEGDHLSIQMGSLRAFGVYDSSQDTSIPVAHCDDTAITP